MAKVAVDQAYLHSTVTIAKDIIITPTTSSKAAQPSPSYRHPTNPSRDLTTRATVFMLNLRMRMWMMGPSRPVLLMRRLGRRFPRSGMLTSRIWQSRKSWFSGDWRMRGRGFISSCWKFWKNDRSSGRSKGLHQIRMIGIGSRRTTTRVPGPDHSLSPTGSCSFTSDLL